MGIKEKFSKNSAKIQKRIKQSLYVATIFGALFFPSELNKPSNPHYIHEAEKIERNYNFQKAIIKYPTEDYFSRKGLKIENIIVHATDHDSEKRSLNYFSAKNDCNVHYLICKDGTIYSLAPEQFATYHAGNYFNKRSIGIEVVQGVHGDFYNRKELFTPVQIEQTVTLIKILMKRYDIPKENIIGHHEFNRKKGDPGERNMGAISSRID